MCGGAAASATWIRIPTLTPAAHESGTIPARSAHEDAMRFRLALALLPAVTWATSTLAQDSATVTACESLLAARRIDAAAGSGQPAAPEAECRRIPRSQVGSVEQRAMIGGAPYECMTVVGGGRCRWIVP
jgi:hypothetical protein